MSKTRLETFTDGVIAILITILVLELHLPASTHSWSALWRMGPVFAAYVLSFFLIAGLWVSHHNLLVQTKVVTTGALWANIHFLFWLSLMPAVTAWFGTDIHAVPAAMLFQLDVIAINLSFLLLRAVLLKSNPEVANLRIRDEVLSFFINFVTLFATIVQPILLFGGLVLRADIKCRKRAT